MSRQRLSSAIHEVETSCETMRLVEEEIARLQASLRQMREDVAVSLNERVGPAMAGELMQMVKEGLPSEGEAGPEATAAAMEVIAAGMQGLRRRLEKSGHVDVQPELPASVDEPPAPVAPEVSPGLPPVSSGLPPVAATPVLPITPRPDEAIGNLHDSSADGAANAPSDALHPSVTPTPEVPVAPPVTRSPTQARQVAAPPKEAVKTARKPKRRTVMFGINVASRPEDKVDEMISQAESDAASRTFDQAVLGLKGKNHWRMVLYKAAHEYFSSQLPAGDDAATEDGETAVEVVATAAAEPSGPDPQGVIGPVVDDGQDHDPGAGQMPSQETSQLGQDLDSTEAPAEEFQRSFAPITEEFLDQSDGWEPELDAPSDPPLREGTPEHVERGTDSETLPPSTVMGNGAGDSVTGAPSLAASQPSLSPRADERRPKLDLSSPMKASQPSSDAGRPPPRRPSFLQNQLGAKDSASSPAPSVVKEEDDWDDPYGDRKAAVTTLKPTAGPIPVNGPLQRERPANVRPNLGIPLSLPARFKLPPNVG